MDDQFVKTLQDTHIAIWNERDRAKREALMLSIYATDIKMYDKDFILSGQKEISDFIEKLHADPSFEMSAAKPMEFVQNGARLFWHIKIPSGILNGMDFFVMENDKAKHLYAFMEGVHKLR